MKFIKKAAALIFCLALALSVMAISAAAADPVFTVTLEQAATDTHTNINGNDYFEYNQGDTAVYNIVLKADNQQVTALDFKLDTPSGLTLTGVTSTFVTGSTVTKNSNSVYSLTLSTTDNGNTVPLTTNNTNGTVVATATYTVGTDVANSATLEFKVTDIVVHVKDAVSETTDTVVATKTIEVDPQYNITVYNPATNTTTGVIETPDDKSSVADTTSTGFTYSIFDGVSTTITTPTSIDGYTFNATFHVEDPASGTTGNWQDNESVAQSYTIASVAANTPSTGRKWGNVDIVADYTATTYTVTYDLANNPVATAAITGRAPESSVSENTMTYTIESVVTDTAANKTKFGKATRAGYTFKGWTIGTPEAKNSTGTDTSDTVANSFWTTFNPSPNKFQSQSTDDTVQKAFGNVTLTANWEIVGKRAEVAYKYANSGHVLILFAVPNTVDGQNRASGTYRCGGEGDVNKMFVLSDSAANSAQSDVASALLNAYVTLFDTNDGVTSTGWTIYGYIAAPNTVITFTSGESDGNTSILYNGDVNKNSSVNAGDYGIAYDLVSGWANYSYNDLTVENRLRAHIDAAAKIIDNNAVTMVGTIADINAIMLLAGNSIT